jgi:tetratricopeptide (TPR) repeat protein
MRSKITNLIGFWEELKQRKVVRSMMVYIAGSCALLQAVDVIFPGIGMPSWSVTALIFILAAGLVVVVALTWIFDITPEGIKRTDIKGDKESDNVSDVRYMISEKKDAEKYVSGKSVSYDYKVPGLAIHGAKRKDRIYNYSSIMVILAVAVLFTFTSAHVVPFQKRDWVVITDFDNQTSDPVFDKSLYTAFTLTANQSRYINIFPRSRMLETLRRMEKDELSHIDEETGREIAMREGYDLFIVPGISRIGDSYSISAKIMDTKTGTLLKSEVVSASGQDEILDKVDQLSRRLRRHLGESRYHIASQDKPLKKVTTSSLEALKFYSVGIDHHLAMDFSGAKEYYENALTIDTGFTSAKASLGNLLYERFDRAKGVEMLKDALKTVDKLTERERLGILCFYAVNVEKDLQKGINYAKMRIDLYPDDAAARNNLGWYYMNSGRYQEALNQYKAAVNTFPDMVLTYGGICWIYLEKLGKIDSGYYWSGKLISDNPGNVWGYFYKGSSCLGLDSLNNALKYFLRGYDINPGLMLNTYRLAHTCRLLGNYQKAIEILQMVYDRNNDETSALYDLGINYTALGRDKEAAKYYNLYKKVAFGEWLKNYPEMPETYFAMGAISARTGDIEKSKEMLQKAAGMDSTRHEKFAELLSLQGRITEAVTEIEKALKKGYRDIVWLKINPDYQALQNEPEFKSLLNRYFKN